MKTYAFMRLRARVKSGGIAIVTAIFLLVALAGLAAAVVTLTTAQQSGTAQDMQGMRAYQAARAGIEWALYTAQQSGLNPPRPALTFNCTSSAQSVTRNVALPANTTLSAFTVTLVISCDSLVAGIAGGDANDMTAAHVKITATACNQPAAGACPNLAPGADYVQRVITAQL